MNYIEGGNWNEPCRCELSLIAHTGTANYDLMFVRVKIIRTVLCCVMYNSCGGQYIVGIYVSLAFWRFSQVQDWSTGWGKTYKNV